MLSSTMDILRDARQGGYAVPGFNVTNFESVMAAIRVSEKLGHPVILQLGERYLDTVSLEGFSAMARAMAAAASVPVALHLDHAYRFESILMAIRCGFTSVMFDGSALPIEENLRQTAEIARIAHAAGVTVEAEIGSVIKGDYSDEEEGTGRLTDPAEAAYFVKGSQADYLAAAIGTVHGMYAGECRIDIPRLREIGDAVSVPLVLHGGSGTPEELLRACITNGICKININTEVSLAAVRRIEGFLQQSPNAHIARVMNEAQLAMEETMERFILICKNR